MIYTKKTTQIIIIQLNNLSSNEYTHVTTTQVKEENVISFLIAKAWAPIICGKTTLMNTLLNMEFVDIWILIYSLFRVFFLEI